MPEHAERQVFKDEAKNSMTLSCTRVDDKNGSLKDINNMMNDCAWGARARLLILGRPANSKIRFGVCPHPVTLDFGPSLERATFMTSFGKRL